MRHMFRFLLFTMVSVLMAGCTLNSVQHLPTGSAVHGERAIVIYGLGVQGNREYPRFGVILDEYNVHSQNITGDCWRYNRTEASIPSTRGPIKYFAFDVAPGYYAYSAFNGSPLESDTPAFLAPAGKITYIGDFIFTQNQNVVVLRDIDTLKKNLDKSLPDIKGEIYPAESVPVQRPRPFLCMP